MSGLATNPSGGMPAFLRKPACDEAGATGHAAGVLHIDPEGHVLLLHRSGDEANFAHHWALPGGGVEDGETPLQGAERESREEMGGVPEGRAKLLDRRRTPTGMVFHTFVKAVPERFVPKLNGEHSGYTWAPLDKLPGPLHPAVARTLGERVGQASDMTPEDWAELRDGFVKWTLEEEAEPEHAGDADLRDVDHIDLLGRPDGERGIDTGDVERVATDSALRLAMDRESIREKSPEGHLHVHMTPISKATVNPYRGKEIPNAEALGLEPETIYYLLRDPEELAKAAATFNGKPLLRKHTPVSAEDHATEETVGAVGTDAAFEDPYLKATIVVWPQDDIEAIENEVKRELSSGYRYRAEMTPGIFRGMRYDGVMRDIVGNHVALVKDGRAGPDVVVGDSMENLMAKPTRLAALACMLTSAAVAPLLARDAKIDLTPVFKDVTSKNFSAKKLKMALDEALEGKLSKDASVEHAGKMLEGLEAASKGADESVSEEQHKAMEAAAHGNSNLGIPKNVGQEYVDKDNGKAFDAEPLRNFLKGKGMGDEDIGAVMDMLPKGMAGDEDDEEKSEEAEEKMTAAVDAAVEKERKAMDEKMKGMVTRTAMDEAIKVARDSERAIAAARDEVRPYVGALTMAFDSADEVYRKTAEMLGIENAKTIHASALPQLIRMQPKTGAQPVRQMAMDEASTQDFAKRFPGADRIAVG